MKRAMIAVAAALAGVATSQARIIIVDNEGPADFATIQAAIDDSNDGDTVLVADGTYTGDGNRDIDFNGRAIAVKSQNGPENCIIDCNGSETDRHRGFYFHSGEGRLSAVIGFTITNGYAPAVCLLPMPPFNCDFPGGGIYCKESNPAISNCIITRNQARKGGGIYYEECSPRVRNCTIAGNYAADWGGGMAINSSIPEICNCIITSNAAPNDPQIYIQGSGSDTVGYSDVEGGSEGTGNIDADPCFADPCNGDYHLKSQGGRWDANEGRWTMDEVTSLCIDASYPMTPIGPEPFPNGGIINMGAYGGTAEASKSYFGEPPCEVIVAGDVNGDCRVDFSDFSILAVHWLECAVPQPQSHENYFPLHVGNSWTYVDFYEGSTKTLTIIDIEEINGHTYYKFDDYFKVCCFPDYLGYPPEDNNILFRYDPESDRVLQFWPSMNQDVVRYDFSGDEFGEGAGHQLIESGITQEVPAGRFSDCCEFGFAMNLWCGYFRETLAPNVGNIEFITNGGDFKLQSYTIYPVGD